MKIFCKIIWNWLNNHTDDKIGFFLCEIKLFQIGNSDIAPSFTVVGRPNDWTKEIRKTTATNPTQQQRLEYWQAFNDYAFQNAEFNKAFNKCLLSKLKTLDFTDFCPIFWYNDCKDFDKNKSFFLQFSYRF